MTEPVMPAEHEHFELAAALGEATWIDLSLTLADSLPSFWPGHMPFQRHRWDFAAPKFILQVVPYQTGWWTIDEHSGTHFDAPNHFIPPPESGLQHAGPAGDISGEKIDVRRFHAPAAVVDVTHLRGRAEPGTSPWIEPHHLLEWEETHGSIRADEAILFRTDWDELYRRGEDGMSYTANVLVAKTEIGWPAPSVEAIDLLLDRGVGLVGTDAPTIGAAHDGMPVHWRGLSEQVIYVEGLTRLHELPPRGAYFLFMPVKVEGASGGPGRAVAIVPS